MTEFILKELSFDYYGNNPDNLITEKLVIAENCPYLIPTYAPFYLNDLVVKDSNGNIIQTTKYSTKHHVTEYEEQVAQDIMLMIQLDDSLAVTGKEYEVTYHSLGAEVMPSAEVARFLAVIDELGLNVDWDKVFGKPDTYPGTKHAHNIKTEVANWVEATYLLKAATNYNVATAAQAITVDSLEETISAIWAKLIDIRDTVNADYVAHDRSYNNPHGVDKATLGLGNVNNWPAATDAEATAGKSNVTYVVENQVVTNIESKAVVANPATLETINNLEALGIYRGDAPIGNWGGLGGYLPPAVGGDFRGSIGSTMSKCIHTWLLEENGDLVGLRFGTDGNTKGLYYLYREGFAVNPDLNIVRTVTQYTHPSFGEYTPISVSRGPVDEVMLIEAQHPTTLATKRFIVITNGTLDYNKHQIAEVTNLRSDSIGYSTAVINNGYVYIIYFISGINMFLYQCKLSDVINKSSVEVTDSVGWSYSDIYGLTTTNTTSEPKLSLSINGGLSKVYANVTDFSTDVTDGKAPVIGIVQVDNAKYGVSLCRSDNLNFLYAKENDDKNSDKLILEIGAGGNFSDSTANNSFGLLHHFNIDFKNKTIVYKNPNGGFCYNVTPTGSKLVVNGIYRSNAKISTDFPGASTTYWDQGYYLGFFSSGYGVAYKQGLQVDFLPRYCYFKAPNFTSKYAFINNRDANTFTYLGGKVSDIMLGSVNAAIFTKPVFLNDKDFIYLTSTGRGATSTLDSEIDSYEYTFVNKPDTPIKGYSPTSHRSECPNSHLVPYITEMDSDLSVITHGNVLTNGSIYMIDTGVSEKNVANDIITIGEYNQSGTNLKVSGKKTFNSANLEKLMVDYYSEKYGVQVGNYAIRQYYTNAFIFKTEGFGAFAYAAFVFTGDKQGLGSPWGYGYLLLEVEVKSSSEYDYDTFTVIDEINYTLTQPGVTGVGDGSAQVVDFAARANTIAYIDKNGDRMISIAPYGRLAVNGGNGSRTINIHKLKGETKWTKYQDFTVNTWQNGPYYVAVPKVGICYSDLTAMDTWSSACALILNNYGDTVKDIIAYKIKNKFVLNSIKLEAGWIVYFTEEVTAVFNGKQYNIPTGSVDLRTISGTYANTTFYVYITCDGYTADYRITPKPLPVSGSQLYLGTIRTGDKQITSIDVNKVNTVNGLNITTSRQGSSISTSTGTPIEAGMFKIVKNSELK